MWQKITGKSDASSHDGRRKEHGAAPTRRRAESVVSSATSRNPSSRVEDRSDYPPTISSRSMSHPPPPSVSSIGTYATARDYDARSEKTAPSRSGFDDDDLRSVRSEKRRDDDSRSTRSGRHRDDDLRSERPERRRDRSSSRDRKRDRKEGDREHKKDKKDTKGTKDKQDKGTNGAWKKPKTRTRSGSKPSEIVDEPMRPRAGDVSVRGTGTYEPPLDSPATPQYASQYGDPSTGQTPRGYERMDAHVANQFPGQQPMHFSAPYRPPLDATESDVGFATDYYDDHGQSVQFQPGIRPDEPSIIVGAEPHLMTPSSVPHPPSETGHGAAVEYYGNPTSSHQSTTNGDRPPVKPPRPQSMPGSFEQDPPVKPPRPGTGKMSTAAAATGGAALGYALGHDSSSSHHTSNAHQSSSSTSFYQQQSSNYQATDSIYTPPTTVGTPGHAYTISEPSIGGYAQSATSKPGKSGKHSSHSNAGLYAAGAAGLAAGAYGLHDHHASHHHSSSLPLRPSQNGGYYPNPLGSQAPSHSGLGMGVQHRQRGPVDKLVDWWQDHEDVMKMEEYTEYIGVCRHCFDPREPPTMAPRKHHYHSHRRSGGSHRNSRVDKESRYRYSSSDDERQSKSHSWVAKGLAGYGIAKVGKALWWQNQDFDDTHSAKSGRRHRSSRSSVSARSRSDSRDRRSVTSRGVVRHRSRSRDSRVSRGYTSDRKDYKVVHRHSDSRSRSGDRKSGLFSAAAGAALGASAAGAAKHHSRSRSNSPQEYSWSNPNVTAAAGFDTAPRLGYVRKQQNEDRPGSASIFGLGEKEHNRTSRHSVVSSSSRHDDMRSQRSSKQNTGGVFGGIFSAGPSSTKRHKAHAKKKKGFFSFANSSSSSSDDGLTYGGSTLSRRSSTQSKRNSGRKKRRDSDEKLNATLVGLGATAAALAVAQGRDKRHSKRKSEIMAGRESKGLNGARHSSDRTRMPGSFVGSGSDSDEESWESASEDESDTSSVDSGLAFGEYGPRSRKSVESLRSDASGTNKWSWRWGSKKDKRKSHENLKASAGLAGAGLAGAAAADNRSSASSVPTLQTVYPVATSDPTAFDAVRRSGSVTSHGQPLMTSRPESVPLQQPQPVMLVSNAVYTTQAAYAPTSTYTAPSGPPVFSGGVSSKPPPTTFPGLNDRPEPEERPPIHRRGNSSPTMSSTKHDLAIAGVAAAATAGAITAMHSGSSKRRTSSPSSRPSSARRLSSPSSVRFELTQGQRDKEDNERRKDLKRKEDERAERERERDRQRERERELERQRDLEREREYEMLRRAEEEARQQERRQQEQAGREAAARREADEAREMERAAREEAEHKESLDRETERLLHERAEAAHAAAERERVAREEMERLTLAHENATREREQLEREILEQELNRKRAEDDAAKREQEREEKLNYDIESRHRELRERERDVVDPEEYSWNNPEVAAAAGFATGAAVYGAAHPSNDKARAEKLAHDSRIEFDDDHLYEDEIMDPHYFHKKDKERSTSPKETGSPHNTAREVIDDLEERWRQPERKQSMAEFFAPPELLDHTTPSKIDRGPDADVQVYHSPYVVTVQPPYDPEYNFTATRDGYNQKDHLHSMVPTLNLIEPTPPVSQAGSTRGDHSIPPSPAVQAQKEPVEPPKPAYADEIAKEKEREEKQRKRSSVTWGADETFHYEAQTPESFREHYVSEQDMRHLPEDWVLQGDQAYADQPHYPGQPHYQDPDEVVVERDSPRSESERRTYHDGAWGHETESPPVEEIKRFEDDGRRVLESTSPEHTPTIITPGEESAKFYQSPFFNSVSDLAAHDVSPSTDPERSQHGYVEGEVVEEPEEIIASKPRDVEPHMPGAWDDDESQQTSESGWAEPKLSKKEQRKRDKASKRATLDAQALAEDVASSTGSLRDSDKDTRRHSEPVFEEPAWGTPLTKKEKKKREKEAANRTSLDTEFDPIAAAEAVKAREEQEPIVQPEAEWEAPLSKKEQKKRDKTAKRASLSREESSSSLPCTPADEPKAEDLWEDEPSGKKDKKKKNRESFDRDPRDIDPRDIEPSWAYPSPSGDMDKESSRGAKSDYGIPPSRATDRANDKPRRRSFDEGPRGGSAVPMGFATAAEILSGGLSESKRREVEPESLYSVTSPSQQLPHDPYPPSTSAPDSAHSNGGYVPYNPFAHQHEDSPPRSIPSTAFHDYDELADTKQPAIPSKKGRRRSRPGMGSISPGSPLRSELAFEDYIGMDAAAAAAAETVKSPSKHSSEPSEAANVPLPGDESPPLSPPADKSSKSRRSYYDELEEFPAAAGVALPTDPYGSSQPRDEPRHSPEREERDKYSPERGYTLEEEGERKKHRHHQRQGSGDRDTRSVASDERDSEGRRKHRHHRRRESERSDDTRSIVSGESYDADGHRKHKHRKRRSVGDDDTRSMASEFRDDEDDERRRHKHRRSKRESEIFDDSLRDRDARSDPGDILDREDPERRRHRRRSKREGDLDDEASVVSSPAKYYEDDKKKDKDKEKKGIFASIFGKSKESLPESTSSSKSHDKSRDDDDGEEHRHRRRKHRSSTLGSSYASDDDSRSVVSASRRGEKRHSGSRDDSGMDYSRHYKVHTTPTEQTPLPPSLQLSDDFPKPPSILPDPHPAPFTAETASSIDDREELLNELVYSKDDTTTAAPLGNGKRDSGESFLGARARGEERLPPLPIDLSAALEHYDDALPIFTALPRSRSSSPTEVDSVADLPALPQSRPGSPDLQPSSTASTPQVSNSKRGSPLLDSLRKTSATAVPLHFRGFGSPRIGNDPVGGGGAATSSPSPRPASTAIPIPFLAQQKSRRASTSAPSSFSAFSPPTRRSPVSQHHSPTAADALPSVGDVFTSPTLSATPPPLTRHKRATSTEFKGGPPRPLYLVERTAQQAAARKDDDNNTLAPLPSLPSSRSASVSQDSGSEEWASAVEDADADADADAGMDESVASIGESGYASATEGDGETETETEDWRSTGLRIDTSGAADAARSSLSPADLLDSETSTPRAGAFFAVPPPPRSGGDVMVEGSSGEEVRSGGGGFADVAAALVGGAAAAAVGLVAGEDRSEDQEAKEVREEFGTPPAATEGVDVDAPRRDAEVPEAALNEPEEPLSTKFPSPALDEPRSITSPAAFEDATTSSIDVVPTATPLPADESASTDERSTTLDEPTSTIPAAPAVDEPIPNTLTDFMAGEHDDEDVEEARLAAAADRARQEEPDELDAERDREEAVGGWYAADDERPASPSFASAIDESETIQVSSSPRVPSAFVARETEGKGVDEVGEELTIPNDPKMGERDVNVGGQDPFGDVTRDGGESRAVGSEEVPSVPAEAGAVLQSPIAEEPAGMPLWAQTPSELGQEAVGEGSMMPSVQETVDEASGIPLPDDSQPAIYEELAGERSMPGDEFPGTQQLAEQTPLPVEELGATEMVGRDLDLGEHLISQTPDQGPASEGIPITPLEEFETTENAEQNPALEEVSIPHTAELAFTLEQLSTTQPAEDAPAFEREALPEPTPAPEADAYAEFAPVLSSRKKKKGKKGKKGGSGSGSASASGGFATPVEEAVVPASEPTVEHAQHVVSEAPAFAAETPNAVAEDAPVVPVVDQRGVHEVLEGGVPDEAVQPVEDEQFPSGGEPEPEQESVQMTEADPEAEFMAAPAKSKNKQKKKKGKKGRKSVSDAPVGELPTPTAAEPAAEEAPNDTTRETVMGSLLGVLNADEPVEFVPGHRSVEETGADVVSGPPPSIEPVDSSVAATVPLPEFGSDGELGELPLEERNVVSQLPEVAPATVPLPGFESDGDLVEPPLEEHNVVSRQPEVVPAMVPLPDFESDRDLVEAPLEEPLQQEHDIVPQQPEMEQRFEAGPGGEFSVAPSSREKQRQQDDHNMIAETSVPHAEIAVPPLPEGDDGDLLAEQEELQQFRDAEEAMKIDQATDVFPHDDEELVQMPEDEQQDFQDAEEAMRIYQPAEVVLQDQELDSAPVGPAVSEADLKAEKAVIEETEPVYGRDAFQANVPAQFAGDPTPIASETSTEFPTTFSEEPQPVMEHEELQTEWPSQTQDPTFVAPGDQPEDTDLPRDRFGSLTPDLASEVFETALNTGELPETTMAAVTGEETLELPALEHDISIEPPVAEEEPATMISAAGSMREVDEEPVAAVEEHAGTGEYGILSPTSEELEPLLQSPATDAPTSTPETATGSALEPPSPVLQSADIEPDFRSETVYPSVPEETRMAPIEYAPQATDPTPTVVTLTSEHANPTSEMSIPSLAEQAQGLSIEDAQEDVKPELPKDFIHEQSSAPAEKIPFPSPDVQPEDEWAIPKRNKSKKKGKKTKRASTTQSPLQVESPAPGSPTLEASTTNDVTRAALPTQDDPAVSVDLTQPARSENFDAREITPAATGEAANAATDDVRGPATPAADPTVAVSEENPANPGTGDSRGETPPYAGEWELPAHNTNKSRGEPTGEVEEVEPIDEQISRSASPVPEAIAAVDPVVDDAWTADPVAASPSTHHQPSTPQRNFSEEVPESSVEVGSDKQEEQQHAPLQTAESVSPLEQQPAATEAVIAEDDEFSMPPKKNKKGKKAKKQGSTSSTPIEQLLQTNVKPEAAAAPEGQVAKDAAAVSPVETHSDEATTLSIEAREPDTSVEADEDEWSVPVKGNKKKSKKGKKGFLDVVQDAVQAKEATPVLDQDVVDTPVERAAKAEEDEASKPLDVPETASLTISQEVGGSVELADTVEEVTDVSAAAIPAFTEEKPLSREFLPDNLSGSQDAGVAQSGVVTEESPVSIETASVQQQPIETDAEDLWSFPTPATKKNKKKKKGKQVSVEEPSSTPHSWERDVVDPTPADEPREFAEVAEPQQSEEVVPTESQQEDSAGMGPAAGRDGDALGEVIADDEWAVATPLASSSSKKKKRKGKKGKVGSVSETPPVVEEVPVVEEPPIIDVPTAETPPVAENTAAPFEKESDQQLPETENVELVRVTSPLLEVDPTVDAVEEEPVDEVRTIDQDSLLETPAVVEEAPVIEEHSFGNPRIATSEPGVEEEGIKPAEIATPQENVPIAEETDPIVEESVPTIEEAAPVMDETVPVVGEAVPVVEPASPAEEMQEDKLQLAEEPQAIEGNGELSKLPTAVELVNEELASPSEGEAQRNFQEPASPVEHVRDDWLERPEESKAFEGNEGFTELPAAVELVNAEPPLPSASEDEASRSFEEPLSTTEPIAVESPTVEDLKSFQQVPDDTWTAPTSKMKGKKGKKGKQRSISTTPAEVSEPPSDFEHVIDTPRGETLREEAVAPTEPVAEVFDGPTAKKDKKKKRKAAAAAAAAAALLDDAPVAEANSPVGETPAVEKTIVGKDMSPIVEKSETSGVPFSFADAASALAAGLADEKHRKADSENLYDVSPPTTTEKAETAEVQGGGLFQPDDTVVKEASLPDSPEEATTLEAAYQDTTSVEPRVDETLSPKSVENDFLAPDAAAPTTDLPDSKDRDASVASPFRFADAAGILAGAVAESKRDEASPEWLMSAEPKVAETSIRKDDFPSAAEIVPGETSHPETVGEGLVPVVSASEDNDVSLATEEGATDQSISDVAADITATHPIENQRDMDMTPVESTPAPKEAFPFAKFASAEMDKKNRRKGRKSISVAAPATEEFATKISSIPAIEDIAVAEPIENEPQSQRQTKEITESTPGDDRKHSTSPRQDVEFAATLAAGLQDSGFDPSLVLNDPTFHERKSPPGSALEADPDDVFAPTKSKKNKRKNKSLAATPDVEGEPSELATPVDPVPIEAATQNPALINAPVQDAAFAAAMSSILDDPTFSRRTPSPDAAKEAVSDEFFPFQKRPKKKGRKSQDISPEREEMDRSHPGAFVEEPTPIVETLPQDESAHMDSEYQTTDLGDGPRSAAVDSPAVEAPTDVPTAVENPAPETGVADVEARDLGSLDTGRAAESEVHEEWPVSPVAEASEWALPIRKKNKKGKKGRKGVNTQSQDQSGQQTPVNEAPAPVSTEPLESTWPDPMEKGATIEVPAESGSLVKMLEQPREEVREEVPRQQTPREEEWDFLWKQGGKESKGMSVEKMAEEAAMPTDEKAVDEVMNDHKPELGEPTEVWAAQGPMVSIPEIKTPQRQARHELISPADSQGSKIATLFPGLERVKRKVPPPKQEESSPVDHLLKRSSRSSLVSERRSQEPLRQSSRSPMYGERRSQEPLRQSSRSPMYGEQSNKEEKRDVAEPSAAPGGLGAAFQPTWSFPLNLPDRDSAVTMNDTPILPSQAAFQDMVRDSGYHDSGGSPGTPIDEEEQVSPAEQMRVDVETGPEWETTVMQGQSAESVATKDNNDYITPPMAHAEWNDASFPDESTAQGMDFTSPPESLTTTRQRSSTLFQSSPSTGSILDTPFKFETPRGPQSVDSSPPTASREVQQQAPASLFGDPTKQAAEESEPSTAPSTTPSRHLRSGSIPMDTIRELSPEDSPLSKKGRHLSDVGMPEHGVKSLRRSFGSGKSLRDQVQSSPGHPEDDQGTAMHLKTPSYLFKQTDEDGGRERAGSIGEDPFVDKQRSLSVMSDRSHNSSIYAKIRTPEHIRPPSSISHRSITPELRRVSRTESGDLRAASQLAEAKARAKSPATSATPGASSEAGPSTYDRVRDKGKARVIDMSESFVSECFAFTDETPPLTVSQEGWGDAQRPPLSPTRPHSVRKRQSIHIMDLETRLDQLVSENRLLQEAKARAEEAVQDATVNGDRQVNEAVEARDAQIRVKDAEIAQISEMLHNLRQEIARLNEVNDSLTEANRNLSNDTNQRYATLQAETLNAQRHWEESERALEQLREQHSTLSTGMEGVLRQEIKNALKDKDAEIHRLHEELADATEQVKSLQRQILDSKQGDSFLTVRDEDYFDSACQQLCQHVQQWVLRFSKFSDTRACRLSSDVKDEKIETRLDNAILDGTDVDMLLADRVRRRDVFMSVVMTMIWEYVFTRYLFGMDREQRQKLKALEKTLTDVGPPRAVAQWRAITLTLLSKREHFEHQRTQDTEAVVHEIFSTLASLLPPPSHLADKIQESLRNVLRLAVNLSIEMRTQRSEYIMLPPLQPEYDTNGDLVRKVYFNASLMNERSGETSSNDELEAARAVVKIVLFPLVVKKGDDLGEGEDEIVVCPAQVLTAKPPAPGRKVVRVLSGAMEIEDRRSVQSRSSLGRFPPPPPGAPQGGLPTSPRPLPQPPTGPLPPREVGSPTSVLLPEGSGMDTTF